MKKQFVFVMTLGVIFSMSSCEKSDVSPSGTSSTASAAKSAAAVSTGTSETDTTKVPGKDCKITPIEASALPEAVTGYITAHYSGATIERAGTGPDGKYLVGIKKADGTHAGLLFDASGTFISEKTGLPPRGPKGTPVATSALPAAVTSYISSNYSGATVEGAQKLEDGSYAVLVKKADDSLTGLAFDASGNFTSELPAPPKDAPQGPRPGDGQRRK